MIIDTSAIIAILRDEPEAKSCARAIADATIRRVSAVNFVKSAVVIDASRDPIATRRSVCQSCKLPNPTQILTSTPAPAPDMTSPLVLVAEPKVQPEVPAVVPAPRAARTEAPPQHKPVTVPRDFGLAGM